jgi:hypothetical protein
LFELQNTPLLTTLQAFFVAENYFRIGALFVENDTPVLPHDLAIFLIAHQSF